MSKLTQKAAPNNDFPWKIMDRAMRDPRLSHGAFRTLCALRSFSDRSFKDVWPSLDTLAKVMHAKADSVAKWVRQLEAAGYIVIASHGRKHVHRYSFVLLPPVEGEEKKCTSGLSLPPSGIVATPIGGDEPIPKEPLMRTMKPNSFSVGVLVNGLVAKVAVRCASAPSVEDVAVELERQFEGAGQFAPSYVRAMNRSGWRDRTGQPIANWKPHARRYASAAELRRRTACSKP